MVVYVLKKFKIVLMCHTGIYHLNMKNSVVNQKILDRVKKHCKTILNYNILFDYYLLLQQK